MGWTEFLSVLMTYMVIGIVLAIGAFALIGIVKVHSDYKHSKWQKRYGDRHRELEEKTQRSEWEDIERLKDKEFLLEEVLKGNRLGDYVDKVNKIISEIDYGARYKTWSENEARWTVYSLSSMAGGFGSTKKAEDEIQELFGTYEKERMQQLRDKLG